MQRTKRILIVDDEEVVRNICERSLSSHGYNVTCAENAIKALNRLSREQFDVVFSDLKMPVMTGLELLRAIKRDYPHIEVIIMTGYATIESSIHAMKNGAYDFILKPVKPDGIRFAAAKCFEKIKLSNENSALKNANQKLADVKDMKDKFIAITSHELRTPVSHLKGYLGILNDPYFHELGEEEKKQCMNVIFDAVEELEDIVSVMHGIRSLEDSGLKPRRENCDLAKLTRQVVASYNIIAHSRGRQSLQCNELDHSIQVCVNVRQIKGIMGELIRNAIKFTPDGGKIQIKLIRENQYCVLFVSDTGIGIDIAEQGKIFETFYEVQNSEHHSSSHSGFMGGGLGLGLNYVRSVVETHGGGVKVKSEKGKGSEFSVYLPLSELG